MWNSIQVLGIVAVDNYFIIHLELLEFVKATYLFISLVCV